MEARINYKTSGINTLRVFYFHIDNNLVAIHTNVGFIVVLEALGTDGSIPPTQFAILRNRNNKRQILKSHVHMTVITIVGM